MRAAPAALLANVTCTWMILQFLLEKCNRKLGAGPMQDDLWNNMCSGAGGPDDLSTLAYLSFHYVGFWRAEIVQLLKECYSFASARGALHCNKEPGQRQEYDVHV